jgi:hypothetical protein
VGPRVCLGAVEKRKYLTPPGIETRSTKTYHSRLIAPKGGMFLEKLIFI